MRFLWLFVVLFFMGSLFAVPYIEGMGQSSQIKEDTDYRLLASPGATDDPNKIEVREFFYYGCPHCYKLEGPVKHWASQLDEDVYFTKSAAVLNPAWEPLGRAFYIAQALEKPALDEAIFKALHDYNRKIYSREAIQVFFADYDVSKAQFDKAYESFSINQLVNMSKTLAKQYRLSGVPVFVINGKYVTSASMTGSKERLFLVMNALIAKERALQVSAQ